MIAGMPETPRHAFLSRGQDRALRLAVAVVIAGMAMGFVSSFTTLYAAAAAHAWRFPALLPLAVDSGIVAYVLLDHLAVSLGARSRWLHAAAWGLAAFTVWANAAVSAADGPAWRVIHAVMPALWVLGVEALRFTWRQLHSAGDVPAGARIPAGRWVAAPWPTLRLWRRMRLSGETSYPRAVALEDARLHAREVLRAAVEGEHGLYVPAALKRAVRTGRLPASVTDAVRAGLQYGGASRWEPAVASWVTSRLTLPDRLAAQLRDEREAIAAPVPGEVLDPVSDPVPDPVPDVPPAPPVTPSRKAPRKPVKPRPRTMSDDDLMAYIRDLLKTVPDASIGAAMRATGTGRERATKLLERGQAEARHDRLHAVEG